MIKINILNHLFYFQNIKKFNKYYFFSLINNIFINFILSLIFDALKEINSLLIINNHIYLFYLSFFKMNLKHNFNIIFI